MSNLSMFRADEIKKKVDEVVEQLVIRHFGNDIKMNVLQEVITELSDSFDIEFSEKYFEEGK